MNHSAPIARAGRAGERIFGHLPSGLFRLLSIPASRGFYADLLEFLEDEVFASSAAVVPQGEVLDAIKEFVDRQGRGIPLEDEADPQAGAPPEGRPYLAYRRLIETGWLIEHRDRYRRVVDFDGHARLLLQMLLDIKAGRTRSYGGEVLQVLALLEAAQNDPQNKSESVRNACRSARSFLNHLRSVASAMRGMEQEITAQADVASLFSRFFDQFVTEYLIEDYKRLHTDANPLRFRVQINEICRKLLHEGLYMEILSEAYVREGRARDLGEAQTIIGEEVEQIQRVLATLDDHLELIQDINCRVEQRVRNTIRHMERISEADPEGAISALRALSRLRVETIPAGPLPILADLSPIGASHIYQPARRRQPPARTPIRRPEPDPVYLQFQEDLTRYRERMLVTPDRVRAYLDRAMRDRAEVAARDLHIAGLDDFVIFERLPLLRWMGDEDLTRSFIVEQTGSALQTPWIVCPDFIVRRAKRTTAEASHA